MRTRYADTRDHGSLQPPVIFSSKEVFVLQAGEFDREALFEVTHDTALHLAQGDQRADRRALIGGDAGALLRHVDDAAGEIDAVRHDQAAHRIAGDDTAVSAVFRQAENMAVWRSR